jgi:aminoglycoside/choline kinase family phosphotransferase
MTAQVMKTYIDHDLFEGWFLVTDDGSEVVYFRTKKNAQTFKKFVNKITDKTTLQEKFDYYVNSLIELMEAQGLTSSDAISAVGHRFC